MMIYIGIDPGKKGGYAIIKQDACLDDLIICKAFDAETFILDMKALSSQSKSCRCCLEKVGAMRGQGVTSMFSFGSQYGLLQGVLRTLNISYQEILPKRWKGEFGLNNEKKKSVEVCKRLFPFISLLPTERSRVDSDGMAEALLMAEYARRKL